VVIGPHLAARGRAQRRDRDRPGVVRVVLVRVSSRQQPDPRTQLRLDVQHPLAGRDELLGKQVPKAAGALDRPGPLWPGFCPRQQPLRLLSRRAYLQPAQLLFGPADRHRGMGTLVRINPDHHCCHGIAFLLFMRTKTMAGMPNYGSAAGARASLEPCHGKA
jgi:hypothetical protein